MSVELLPPRASTDSHVQAAAAAESAETARPVRPEHSRRWPWRRALALIVLLAVAGGGIYATTAAVPQDTGPQLTHTISRGDLSVSVTEQGTLESSSNTEIKCKVRGGSTVLSVIETGTQVKPGDELVQLDTAAIEDSINEQKIVYQTAVATHTQSKADVAVAEIAVTEYLEGTYRAEMQTLEKDLAIAESNLRTAQNMLEHTRRMFRKGYTSELEVESNEFTVKQAQLELELKQTEIDVLQRFTRAKQLEELRSTLMAKQAKLESDEAALTLAKDRLDRAEQQLQYCVIRAENSGMVIYPSAAEWKSTPDIEEGATVREDQVLLLIPDLSKMQVKVGIHESIVDRLQVGMPARVTLLADTMDGHVASIATVTRPAGWWTGNVVKYDTIVSVDAPEHLTLKPGMTVEVEVILAEHKNVLKIPVAAVIQHQGQYCCWVKTATGTDRRQLTLGDSNDQFIVVKAGLQEGEDVVLNPRALVTEAKQEALSPLTENADQPAAADTDQDAENPTAEPAAKPVSEPDTDPPTDKTSKSGADT